MAGPYILPTVDHLLEEEVDFELRLRKQAVDRRENLEDKKRLLRRLFKEDRKYNIAYEGISKYSEEIKTITGAVEEIVGQLQKKFDRGLISRLRHFLIRIATASVENEEEATAKKEACGQIESVLIELGQHVREDLEEKEEIDSGRKESVSESWRNPDPNSAVKNKGGEVSEEIAKTKTQSGEDKDRDSKYRLINPGALVKTPRKSIRSSFESLNFDKLELKCLEGDCKCGECEGKGTRKKEIADSKVIRNDLKNSGTVVANEYEQKEKRFTLGRGLLENSSLKREFQVDRHHERSLYRSPENRMTSRKLEVRRDISSEREFRKRSTNDRNDSGRRSSSRTKAHRMSNRGRSSSPECRSREYRRYRDSCRDGYYSDSGSDRERHRERHRGRRNRRHYSSSRSPSIDRSKYRRSRVQNWELNFSGDNRSIQVEDFLTRVKKLARHEGVSEKELLTNIHHRLKGEAYDWWFTKEDRFTSWRRFEGEIRFRYGNPNRDRGIRGQIRELKQRRGESFIAYVTEVEKLNQCLERPFSSRTLFELIWENMRPHYRSKLSVITIEDLDHLIEINHKIDANDQTLYRTGQNLRPEVHHLEAEDDSEDYDSEEEDAHVYAIQNRQQQPGGKPPHTSENKPKQQTGYKPQQQPRNNPQQHNSSSRPQARFQTPRNKCWNCLKEGHIWKDCREPKRVFCYACGNMGRTTRNCEMNHPLVAPQNHPRPTN